MENQNSVKETVSCSHNADIAQALKDELDWNETLINRYVGREALWLHRCFLSMCWINTFLLDSGDASYHFKEAISMHHDLTLAPFCRMNYVFSTPAQLLSMMILWMSKHKLHILLVTYCG